MRTPVLGFAIIKQVVSDLNDVEDATCAGLLEDRRAGWPLFRGKELKALPDTHTVRTLGAPEHQSWSSWCGHLCQATDILNMAGIDAPTLSNRR